MSLDSLLWAAVGGKDGNNNDGEELKFLFVGGKGGVGKTTSSSALATLLATKAAKRVLLVSTDPAHSLSDAFRCEFTNVPTSPGITNLDVMEVDPSDTMKAELAKWAALADDIAGSSAEDGTDTGGSGGGGGNALAEKIHGFQEWLSGVPGIDEATALSTAIRWIESGDYDVIVFDTAPTGHTLKLLQMPDVLQAGIERLQSWQGTLWGYWEMVKGFAPGAAGEAAKRRADAKSAVAANLEEYKRGIQKVALMLQDQRRTRFAVVCIAEYLSVSETRRLLQELKKNRVRASHIIVNQLVVKNALSSTELENLEGLAEVGELHLNRTLLGKTVHACRLTTARKAIQEKYLAQLKSFPETSDLEGICEMPLLPEEVTGIDALRRFGDLMVRSPPKKGETDSCMPSSAVNENVPRPLYDDQLRSTGGGGQESTWKPRRGDAVKISGLAKSAQYNGLEGVVISDFDSESGRYGIQVECSGNKKKLALQLKNFTLLETKKPRRGDSDGVTETENLVTEENVSKAKKVLNDPEIKAMIDENPRFKAAVDDVLENPMNFIKYLGDPAMAPLLQKAMAKLQA